MGKGLDREGGLLQYLTVKKRRGVLIRAYSMSSNNVVLYMQLSET